MRRGDGLKVPCYVFAISVFSVYFAAVTRDSDYFIFAIRLPGYPAEENCFYPVLSNYRISALSVTSGRVPAVYPAEGNVLPPRAFVRLSRAGITRRRRRASTPVLSAYTRVAMPKIFG